MKIKEKIVNRLRMNFTAKSVNEGFARISVCGFIASLDPTVEELGDIKTAVSEAVTNCIVHAYKQELGQIYIDAKIYDSGKVSIRIRDKGCGIQDIDKAMQPLYTSSESGERAGLGFALMQSLTDKIKVISKPDKGTTVVLEKIIESRSETNV